MTGLAARGDRIELQGQLLPGHDVRAMQARVREHFGGSPLEFLRWVDAQLAGQIPAPASAR